LLSIAFPSIVLSPISGIVQFSENVYPKAEGARISAGRVAVAPRDNDGILNEDEDEGHGFRIMCCRSSAGISVLRLAANRMEQENRND
jgi:hypothetical protein